MLNDYYGIAKVPQMFKRCNELFIIPLVKTYAGLIKYIQNAHKRRTYLRGKADSLGFSAGKSGSTAGKSEIFQSHVFQKSKARPDFFQNKVRNHLIPFGKLHILYKVKRLLYGHF